MTNYSLSIYFLDLFEFLEKIIMINVGEET